MFILVAYFRGECKHVTEAIWNLACGCDSNKPKRLTIQLQPVMLPLSNIID